VRILVERRFLSPSGRVERRNALLQALTADSKKIEAWAFQYNFCRIVGFFIRLGI